MALVDRRLCCAIDHVLRVNVDLPEPGVRSGVVTPMQVRADGVAVELRNFRLYRDVHYGQQGTHAVHGRPVQLGTGQYFVLGDNGPDSEDSRFWANQGRVEAQQLVGRPFLVHLPSRRLSWSSPAGATWSGQCPDWSRFRWLR
jgi:signal peptidase I